ncbi:MAG: cysteine--tRNA ligase [Firmicutes bacterium]|nr:cysteine--tRNA ligase [Ezakiella sp.]MDD7762191.1 cysteine--tRNA ligase [Bacillota bacterium]
MKLFNSLTDKKEEFIPIKEGVVKMYVCGPTVYNDMHVGNIRPHVSFDILRRYLIFKGYDVKYVSNFTDVDDKIIKKANEEGIGIDEVTSRYIKSVKEDLDELSIYDYPIEHPTCTAHMDDIIEFIEGLIEKGYAYEVDGDVYFRVRKLKDYGKLSNRNVEELEIGARIEENVDKEDPLDFTLWKKKKEGEPAWKSPWSEGRPGWHIECSTMIRALLGKTIDIHAGGEDLKFPHHENEIAQSEALNEEPLAHYWLHNGMINIDNVKMSKSIGNIFIAKDFIEQEGAEVLRFFMLNAHYRKPLNFTHDAIEQVKSMIRRLRNSKIRLANLIEASVGGELNKDITSEVDAIRESLISHMDDDLNTPDAVTDWIALSKLINTKLDDNSSKEDLLYVKKLFDDFVDIFGVIKDEKRELDFDIDAIIKEREEARANKDYKRADEIRDELKEKGIILKDTKDGVTWERA